LLVVVVVDLVLAAEAVLVEWLRLRTIQYLLVELLRTKLEMEVLPLVIMEDMETKDKIQLLVL
jgi:hypothetical protein